MSTKKKYNEDMMAKIVAHKDFGKRNPVDIGLDCGYTEDEVIKMIQALSEEKETENGAENNLIYVLMQIKEKFYIVSVNIDNWETKPIKEVQKFNYADTLYQIKGKIFVWVNEITIFKQKLMWENFETGENGEICVDSEIVDILILDDSIVVLTQSEIIRDEFGKQRAKLKFLKNKFLRYISVNWQTKLVEGKDEMYITNEGIRSCSIFAVGKDLNHVREIKYKNPSSGYNLLIIEYTETEGLTWYWCNGTYGFLSSYREWSYYKYTERDLDGCYGKAPGLYGSEPGHYHILLGISTENYRLIQESILSKDWENEICEFKRMYEAKYSSVQRYREVCAVKNKDIFVGVSSRSYDDDDELIKIDLRNERTPVTLPVQIL